MRSYLRLLLRGAAPAALLAACSSNSPPSQPAQARVDQTVQLDQSFQLAFGKEAALGSSGIHIRFEDVVEDSRCPADVQCPWAGNARIVLRVAGRTPPGAVNDTLSSTLEPHAARYANYEIRFAELAPARLAGQPIDRHAYVATLVVKQVE